MGLNDWEIAGLIAAAILVLILITALTLCLVVEMPLGWKETKANIKKQEAVTDYINSGKPLTVQVLYNKE